MSALLLQLQLAVLPAWRLAALAAELLLLATHLKVLLCVGKPYPAAELSSKRWTYFLFDALSPWNSLAAILAGRTVGLPQPADAAVAALLPLLLLTALGHAALHVYHIVTWESSRHAGNVIQMSAVKDMRSRCVTEGGEGAWRKQQQQEVWQHRAYIPRPWASGMQSGGTPHSDGRPHQHQLFYCHSW